MNITETLDLRKNKVLDLSKALGIPVGHKAKVTWALDYSGSMTHLYRKGSIQTVLERFVPIAMAFDDNGSMPVHKFSSGCKLLKEEVTRSNVQNYISDQVNDGNFGSTSYSSALISILNEAGLEYKPSSTGFLGMGKKAASLTPTSKYDVSTPTYVMFLTDGECDNDDREQSEELIKLASNYNLFFQFIGLQENSSVRFPFLESLDNMRGRRLDNANFFAISKDDLLNGTDEALYSKLLHEYPSWIKEAGRISLIR